MSENLSRKKLVELAKQLATPIDFVELERLGLIKKKGMWYEVGNIHSLPEHARKQIRAIKAGKNGSHLVQFTKSRKAAQRLYRQLSDNGD